MTDLPTPDTAIPARVKAILLKPAEEWPRIAIEPDAVNSLFLHYVVPLAAIGPVCRFLRGQLFGWGAFGISFHPGLLGGLSEMLVSYVLTLVGVFVMALIADALAPKFAGEGSRVNAMKLVAYGATASFIAGAFSLVPGLGILGLLGLYSFYLFYLGATPVMRVPHDKALAFTAVTVLCAVVLSLVVGAVTAPVLGLFSGGAIGGVAGENLATGSDVSGKLTLPGGGAIDLGQANKVSAQLQAATSGKKPPIDPATLQGLLPASVGDYHRTALESSAMGAMGSAADGTYTSGSNSYHLKVTDMAAIGALAGLGAAMGVQENKQDADGYEKTGTVDGHLQSEAWHKGSSSGKFSVILDNRFSVEAEGPASSVDDLKAAVAAVDQGKLASLAN